MTISGGDYLFMLMVTPIWAIVFGYSFELGRCLFRKVMGITAVDREVSYEKKNESRD